MDYFLPKDKTYMPPIPDEFPVDPNGWRACIRGTGDDIQAWTCARDVGKAVVELLAASEWVRAIKSLGQGDQSSFILRSNIFTVLQEQTTYVAGEWSTFNTAVQTMEKFYSMPPLPSPPLPSFKPL